MFIKLLLIGGIVGLSQQWVGAQATKPASAAADVYLQAAEMLRHDDLKNIEAPSASSATFPREYPPMPREWVMMEKQDYDLHAKVRELAHQAGLMEQADWPATDPDWRKQTRFMYLNELRNLANELGDAEKYQSLVLHDQPAAFASAADLLRLAEMLKHPPGGIIVQLLVAGGIDALNMSKLMVMVANAKITEDASNSADLPLATATQWIARLMDHPDAQNECDQAMKGKPPGALDDPTVKKTLGRLLEIVHRTHTERDFVAMSLAAHVYQYKHGKWPADLNELKTELPRVPIDPWGDGTQTLGYAMIKGGLPDGSDRPLIYSRFEMKDGLFFRTDEPEYSFYQGDGSRRPPGNRKQGGQFRDVAAWPAVEGKTSTPATQPLE